MPTTTELRARIGEIGTSLKRLVADADAESRDLNSDERESWDTLESELRPLEERVARQETLARLEEPAADAPRPPAPELETPRGVAPAVHIRNDRPYSILRLFQALASGDMRKADVEVRASDEISERGGKSPEGLFVPYRALLDRREEHALVQREAEYRDVQKANTGAELVGTDLIPSEFIELLRNESVVVNAGGRVLPNLVGDVEIPRLAVGAAATWLAAETSDATADTAFDMSSLSLTPKTVAIKVEVSRNMLKQSTPGVEDVVREDIRQSIGTAVDVAAINGDSGSSSGQPDGIINTSGVGVVNAAATGNEALTWADICEFEADLGAANALRGKLAYATNASIASTLKQTLKSSNVAGYLAENNMCNGYPLVISQQIPANHVVFGNWSEVLIGLWGMLDLFGDPYSRGDRGGLVVRGFQDIDVGLRHAASFSICVDAL